MNKTFKIIIVIVGILLVAGAVYFSSQPKNDEKMVTSQEEWKTYTNTEYGFEFKYPKGYKDFETGGYREGALYQARADGTEKFEMKQGDQVWQSTYPIFSVAVFPISSYSFKDAPGGTRYTYDWVQDKCINSQAFDPEIINGSTTPVKINDTTVACEVGTGDAGFSYRGYAIIDGRYHRIIEIGFSSDETSSAPVNIEAILKTFKLINNDNVVPDKTTSCILSKHNYSINYPSTYKIMEVVSGGYAPSNCERSNQTYTLTLVDEAAQKEFSIEARDKAYLDKTVVKRCTTVESCTTYIPNLTPALQGRVSTVDGAKILWTPNDKRWFYAYHNGVMYHFYAGNLTNDEINAFLGNLKFIK